MKQKWTIGKRAFSALLMLALLAGLLPVPTALALDTTADTWEITGTETVNTTRVVRSGETLTVFGSGTLTSTNAGVPLFLVQDGGHLTLDGVTVTGSTVDDRGAVYVEAGGLLDLGYNDKALRAAPSITGNTTAGGAARNLVVEDGARVRLNAQTWGSIGVSYAEDITKTSPKVLVEGGRYALLDTDVAAGRIALDDASVSELVLLNDKVVHRPQKLRVLYWYPTDSFAWARDIGRDTSELQPWDPRNGNDVFKNAGADTIYLRGSQTSRVSFLDDGVVNGNLEQFDLIYITAGVASGSQTVGAYTEAEAEALLAYLDQGGRIFLQAEDSQFAKINQEAQKLAQKLNAGFSLSTSYNNYLTANSNPDSSLAAGVGETWTVVYCTKIEYNNPKSEIVFTYNGQPFCVDISAGSATDGIPWGNVTLLSDGNLWHYADYQSGNTKPNTTQFARNLINNTREHRAVAATGVNPNESFEAQAKIGEAEYRTPAAALNKAVNGETVALQKDADLTAAADELLFNGVTLQQKSGGTVAATADGTTVDIAADGTVALKTGTAAVSADAKFTVGGYTVTTDSGYTVTASDADSPFTNAQGGRASLTATRDLQPFTLEKDGKRWSYTADSIGDKVYPGVFDVSFTHAGTQLDGDEPEKPYYRADYTVTVKPTTGYTLSAADISVTMGTQALALGTGFTATQTAQGVTITVPRVEDNLFITARGNREWPTVTVKGMAKEGGDYTKELYALTTVQELSETKTTADITAWNMDTYKLVGVKIGAQEGTLVDLSGQKGVTLDLTLGDQTVTFLYEKNMADVTIHAYYKDTTDPVESFPTDMKVSAEIGKEFTYAQPTLSGYDSEGSDPADATITVTGTDDHIDFFYSRQEGNVTYKAVDADGGAELAARSESVAKGAAIVSTADKANALFDIPYYQLKADTAATVTGDKDGKYDGQHDVTVTYTYERVKKTVTVSKVNAATGGEIEEQSFPGLETGKEQTLDVTVPTGYKVIGSATVKYFVKNEDGQSVTVYFLRETKATVTVELVLRGETTPFQSYTVTGEYGVELTVEAPAVTGYTYAGTDTDTRTITPTESGPNKITLTYALDSEDVTVRFVNGEDSEIAPAQTFTVKRGDDLTVYAPAISGYQLAAGQDASQTLTSAEIFDQSKTALTFRYARVVDEGFVKHTVIVTTDRGDPGKTLFQYTALVEKGDGSDVTYTAPTMPGYAVQGAQTQTLRNNENGTVYFVYGEDAVSIVIKLVMQGQAEPFARQTLTGYRAGQTVEVVAPAQDGKILVGALTKTVSDLTAGENVVTFEYTDPGNITLTLIEKDSGETIRVLSPGAETTYTAGQGDLDLSGYGYLFTPDGSTAPFNAADGSLAVTSDMLAGAATDYQIYYTKETRGVTYVALDKDKLGDTAPEDATGDMVIQTIENADTARVGESFKAVAPRIPGYTVAGDLTQVISKVEKGDGSPIKVYFLYTEKAIGTVTVRFLKPDGATVLSAYEASSAVGEEFTATAPETLEGGKYKLPDGADRTKAVRITGTDDTIDFVYEANFHTVTVKTQRGDAAAAEFETVEVVSGQNAVLNPPSMGGYVLRGITVGAEGSATTFPAGWDGTANALTLSAVDVDVAVTYHYLAMEENQVMLTVIDKYELYELGRRTVVVTKGQDSEVAVAEYTGYKVTSVSYGGTERELTDGPLTARFGADTEVTFRFVREDGSTAVPGGDGKIGTEDDVIVKPGTDGDPLTTDPDTGNVRLPDGGTVVYPGAPGGNGSTITVPEGTVVDSSGTIHLPEDKDGKVEPDGPVIPGGSTVGPDGTINYKYTLRYVDNQGGEKLPAGSVLVKAGAEQTVTAPAVNGYTVDKERQTITGGTGPFTITFTYTKSSSSGGSSGSATHPPAVADPDQCSGGSSCPIWPFTDASSTAWYHDGVHFCLENGLMIGKSSTVFDPNGTITRGQIVTILWRLEGQPRAGAARYSDVIAGQYYTEAVVWAAENGIVTGYPDGTFHPNASITREQLAAILWRYAKYKGVSMSDQADLSRFTDRDEIAPYAAQAMAWANANGLINGMTATALVPRGDASRAQAASILQRFCENILKG